MKFKNLFKVTKANLRKRMWSNLKYQINSIKNLLNEIGVLKKFHNGHFLTNHIKNTIETSFLTTNSSNTSDRLRLVTACAGISKHLTKPILRKGIIGEDAWFIESRNAIDVLGVADGVGGWQEIGVDPSKFSSNLMKQCSRCVKTMNINDNLINAQSPVNILSEGYRNLVERNDDSLIGSSTACILLFNQMNGYLHSANLGDSGFVVIRDNQIVHRSVEQQHYFNCPFQLALLPNGSNEFSMQDKPESANIDSFKINEGDIIVLATDGLWDNLNDFTLLSHVSELKVRNLN